MSKIAQVHFSRESRKEVFSCVNVISPCNSYVHDESLCENLDEYFKEVNKDERRNFVPFGSELPNFIVPGMDD